MDSIQLNASSSIDEIALYETRLLESLDAAPIVLSVPFSGFPEWVPFYSAPYRGVPSVTLMQLSSRLFLKQLPHLSRIDFSSIVRTAAAEKIRIGVFSSTLLGKTQEHLTSWLFSHLPSELVELVFFVVVDIGNDLEETKQLAADHGALIGTVYVIPRTSPVHAQEVIYGANVDMLVLNDLCMDHFVYETMAVRLAPVQVGMMSNGHTSGIEFIDYVVSSESTEPVNGQDWYSESLVRLKGFYAFATPRLGTTLHQSLWTDPEDRCALLEIANCSAASPRHIYSLLHTPQKFSPLFSALVCDIALADPDAIFLFPRSPVFHLMDAMYLTVLDLWKTQCPAVLSRLHRIPFPIKYPRWLEVTLAADVVLDPYPFGGGLSSIDAVTIGVPVVTLPGPHRSGRLSASIYNLLKLENMVVKSPSDYVRLAVQLASDTALNRHVRKLLTQRAVRIYANEELVLEWTAFALRAVTAKKKVLVPECSSLSVIFVQPVALDEYKVTAEGVIVQLEVSSGASECQQKVEDAKLMLFMNGRKLADLPIVDTPPVRLILSKDVEVQHVVAALVDSNSGRVFGPHAVLRLRVPPHVVLPGPSLAFSAADSAFGFPSISSAWAGFELVDPSLKVTPSSAPLLLPPLGPWKSPYPSNLALWMMLSVPRSLAVLDISCQENHANLAKISDRKMYHWPSTLCADRDIDGVNPPLQLLQKAGIVTAFEVFEHSTNARETVAQWRWWGLPVLFSYCPVQSSSYAIISEQIYKFGWKSHYTESDVEDILNEAGFSVTKLWSGENFCGVYQALPLPENPPLFHPVEPQSLPNVLLKQRMEDWQSRRLAAPGDAKRHLQDHPTEEDQAIKLLCKAWNSESDPVALVQEWSTGVTEAHTGAGDLLLAAEVGVWKKEPWLTLSQVFHRAASKVLSVSRDAAKCVNPSSFPLILEMDSRMREIFADAAMLRNVEQMLSSLCDRVFNSPVVDAETGTENGSAVRITVFSVGWMTEKPEGVMLLREVLIESITPLCGGKRCLVELVTNQHIDLRFGIPNWTFSTTSGIISAAIAENLSLGRVWLGAWLLRAGLVSFARLVLPQTVIDAVHSMMDVDAVVVLPPHGPIDSRAVLGFEIELKLFSELLERPIHVLDSLKGLTLRWPTLAAILDGAHYYLPTPDSDPFAALFQSLMNARWTALRGYSNRFNTGVLILTDIAAFCDGSGDERCQERFIEFAASTLRDLRSGPWKDLRVLLWVPPSIRGSLREAVAPGSLSDILHFCGPGTMVLTNSARVAALTWGKGSFSVGILPENHFWQKFGGDTALKLIPASGSLHSIPDLFASATRGLPRPLDSRWVWKPKERLSIQSWRKETLRWARFPPVFPPSYCEKSLTVLLIVHREDSGIEALFEAALATQCVARVIVAGEAAGLSLSDPTGRIAVEFSPLVEDSWVHLVPSIRTTAVLFLDARFPPILKEDLQTLGWIWSLEHKSLSIVGLQPLKAQWLAKQSIVRLQCLDQATSVNLDYFGVLLHGAIVDTWQLSLVHATASLLGTDGTSPLCSSLLVNTVAQLSSKEPPLWANPKPCDGRKLRLCQSLPWTAEEHACAAKIQKFFAFSPLKMASYSADLDRHGC